MDGKELRDSREKRMRAALDVLAPWLDAQQLALVAPLFMAVGDFERALRVVDGRAAASSTWLHEGPRGLFWQLRPEAQHIGKADCEALTEIQNSLPTEWDPPAAEWRLSRV